MTGYERMPRVVDAALPEIRYHLWSLYWVVRALKARNVVELGVRSGDSTRALLCGTCDTQGEVVSFDQDGDAYRVQEVTAGFEIPWDGFLWTCLKSDSAAAGVEWSDAVRRGTRPRPEILFVDTDHSLETTRRELDAWSEIVTGAMLFHDVGINEPGRDGVLPAILELVNTQPDKWSIEVHQNVGVGDNGLGILWRKAP